MLKMVKTNNTRQIPYHAKFDIYHIYSVQEHCKGFKPVPCPDDEPLISWHNDWSKQGDSVQQSKPARLIN